MKYLPLDFPLTNLRPNRKWFEEDSFRLESTDAKMLMELYIRVNCHLFNHLREYCYEIDEGKHTYEEMFKDIKEEFLHLADAIDVDLAKELVIRGKEIVDRNFNTQLYTKSAFAFYEDNQLVEK